MKKFKGLSLGIKDEDRSLSVEKLDQVFCSLSLALDINLKLFWMTNGSRIGDIYRKKLDMTWSQINQLGLRISRMGANPTMIPAHQQHKAFVSYDGGKTDLPYLVSSELHGEDEICSRIREHLWTLKSGQDWFSINLLGELLVQREEIFHQQETIFEYEPVLEHIWDEEEMSMEGQNQKPQNPMH